MKLIKKTAQKYMRLALGVFFCLCVVGVAFFLTFDGRGKMEKSIRMAIYFNNSAKTLDTSKITTLHQYELLTSLYSRLVEYDSNSQFVADVPESLSWSNDEVTFTFGDKVKSVDGHVITAQDAELSLKRLIYKGKSGHGDIRKFLCPSYKLESINHPCPGIRTESNKLILKVIDPILLPSLLSTLESTDYSIIPKASLNLNSSELEILDYRNTSGPFYVDQDSENGELVLRANPNHYHYVENMPQVIYLRPSDQAGGLQAFSKGEVDLLPASQMFAGDEAKKILSDKSNNIHETMPLRVAVINFSPKALREFTPDQRRYAGQVLGKAFAELFPQTGQKPTIQFFQAMSDGSLTKPQIDELQTWLNSPKKPKFKRPIELKALPGYVDLYRNALKDHPEIQVSEAQQAALTLPQDQRPEIYFMLTDSSWTENFSLLGYNFQQSSFSLPGMNPEEWFRDYISTADKEARIQKLNKLHFDLLMNASIVPINVTPYYTVTKKHWYLDQSTIFPGTALWRLRSN